MKSFRATLSLLLAVALVAASSAFAMVPASAEAQTQTGYAGYVLKDATDSCADFTKLADWYGRTSVLLSQKNVIDGDDADCRFTRPMNTDTAFTNVMKWLATDDGTPDEGATLDTSLYVTYQVPAGASVEFFYGMHTTLRTPILSWSADNKTFTPFVRAEDDTNEVEHTVVDKTQAALEAAGVDGEMTEAIAGKYTGLAKDTVTMPDTAHFVRFNFPKHANHWEFGLSMVRSTGGTAGPAFTYDTAADATADSADALKAAAVTMAPADAFDYDQTLPGIDLKMASIATAYLENKDAVAKPYAVYAVQEDTDFIALVAENWRAKVLGLGMKLYTAADNTADTTWTPLEAVRTRSGYTQESTVASYSAHVPQGAKFVKVEWPFEKDYSNVVFTDIEGGDTNNGGPLGWTAGLIGVRYTTPVSVEPPPVEPIVDTKTNFVTGGVDALEDASQYTIGAFEHDPVIGLILGYNFANGKTSFPKAYVTMRVAEGSPLVVTTARHTNADALDLQPKFYASANGTTWTEFTPQTVNEGQFLKPDGSELTAFSQVKYMTDSIGTGNVFVKFEYPQEKDYNGTPIPNVTPPATVGDPLHYGIGLLEIGYNKSDYVPVAPKTNTTIDFVNNNAALARLDSFTNGAFEFNTEIGGMIVNLDYLSGKTAVEKPYMVFRVGPKSGVIVNARLHDRAYALGLALKFYASKDGVTWDPVEPEVLAGVFTNSFAPYQYLIRQLDEKYSYVKVEYPQDKDLTGAPVPGSDPSPDPLHYGIAISTITYLKLDSGEPDDNNGGDDNNGDDNNGGNNNEPGNNGGSDNNGGDGDDPIDNVKTGHALPLGILAAGVAAGAVIAVTSKRKTGSR